MEKRNKIILTVVLLLLCVMAECFSYAQDLAGSQKRRQEIEKEISLLKRQMNAATSRTEEALSAINLIQAQKVSRQRLIAESDRSIAAYNVQIRDLQKEINKQQEVLDTLKAHYARLVRGAYVNRDVKIWYMYIIGSESITQAFRRFGYFKNLSVQIKNQSAEVAEAQALLNEKKAQMLSLRADAQKVRNSRASELEDLKKDESRQKSLVSKLKKDTKAFKTSLSAKMREKRAIDQRISTMLSKATAAKSSNGKKAREVDYVLAKSFEANKGKLPWPVTGPVVEHYGAYQNKELKLSLFNNGINIACESESLVKSVFDGVVSNIMIAPGYGQCILVQHGNYYTTYCKIKTAFVHPGDKVTTGQVLGEVATIMGKTQLYFLVWKKKYLDPEKWLRPRN